MVHERWSVFNISKTVKILYSFKSLPDPRSFDPIPLSETRLSESTVQIEHEQFSTLFSSYGYEFSNSIKSNHSISKLKWTSQTSKPSFSFSQNQILMKLWFA